MGCISVIIVSVPTDKLMDEKGEMAVPWGNFFDQNTQQMQQNLGQEGFVIPQVSSAANSVMPPTTGGQLAQVQATFGQQNGVQLGTLIFDPAETNGGSPTPNGQLKILLADGVFHKITNT
jgi:hypothetical protein